MPTTDLTPGTITTLGQLRPGDVGEFAGFDGRFIVTGFGAPPWVQIEYDDGQRSAKTSGLIVRYLGRGRIEPARIVMEGEPDRIAELEEQVRTLREAAEEAASNCRNAGQWCMDRCTDRDCCNVCSPLRAVLTATAPKGGEAMTPSDTLTHRAATYLSILNDAARRREGAQLIEQLLARVRELEAGLTWTDAKPTVPGWYWWRAPYSHPEMIHLFRITEDSPLVMDRRNGTYMAPGVGQFAGPIQQPEEPR